AAGAAASRQPFRALGHRHGQPWSLRCRGSPLQPAVLADALAAAIGCARRGAVDLRPVACVRCARSMSRPIEDYALIGDLRTAALVARDGSIDWFCPPRCDAPACFAALLGDQAHGFWRRAPDCEVREASRCYLTDTLILCSEWGTAGGRVRVLDFMPLGESVVILRLVEGLEGQVPMRMQLRPRFGYGKRAGTARLRQDGLLIGEGQGGLLLRGDVQAEPGAAGECVALFEVAAGRRLALELVYSELEAPLPRPAETAWARLDGCRQWWREWVERCSY